MYLCIIDDMVHEKYPSISSVSYQESHSIPFLTFDSLSSFPEIFHASFLRHGGVSAPPYNSLNFGIHCSNGFNDSLEVVEENKRIVQKAFSLKNWITMDQVHGNHVFEVTESTKEIPIADALMTQIPQKTLVASHADCQVAFFYDPINKAIAIAHSGWRGSVKNIYKEVVLAMANRYKTSPQDLRVAITPSLGPDKAEFKHYKVELPESFWSYQVKPFYFDFWAISRDQLMATGILANHIEIAGICTYSHPEDFFSYRRDKITGRHVSIFYLR